MPLLGDKERKQITDIFNAQLKEPVTVHLFTQRESPLALPTPAPAIECYTCRETSELLEEVKALSSNVKLQVHDFVKEAAEAQRMGVDKIPTLVFQGKNRGTVRYLGIPAGYEFSVLIEALLACARGTTRLSARTKQELAALQTPVNIKVLVTPT